MPICGWQWLVQVDWRGGIKAGPALLFQAVTLPTDVYQMAVV